MKISKMEPRQKRYTVRFGDSLFLRVMPSGVKSWVLRHSCHGRVRDITLGRWPALSEAQARQAANAKRSELGMSPAPGMTFREALALWKRKKKGAIVSYHDELAMIERHLMPDLGRLELTAVTAPVALNVLLKIQDRPPTLRRCLMRLNEILELCVAAGLLSQNPCRRLSALFAQHQPEHRHFIPAARLGELFEELKDDPEWLRLYALFAVYSMLRPCECAAVRRSWIEGDTLCLPSEIMKKRRPHRVPLCKGTLALLERVRVISPHPRRDCVWSFGRGGKAVSASALTRRLRQTRLKGLLCHHGLRAAGRTWMQDQGVPREVAEDALAHVCGSQSERAYLRNDLLERRRPIMEKWWRFVYAAYCAQCAPIEGLEPDPKPDLG